MQLANRRIAPPSIRGVLSSRRGMLLMAVLSAVTAAALIVVALSHYRHTLTTGAQQETVLTATGVIQKGESAVSIAAANLYKPLPIPSNRAVGGAVTNAAVLQGEVATRQILPGEQLTTSDFQSSSDTASQLGPTQRAVALTLDPAHGLTGVVQADDHVDVYGSFSSGDARTAAVALIAPNALVLRTSTGSGGSGSNSTTVLLQVTAQQSPELAYAADNGRVWLVLRSSVATNASSVPLTLGGIAAGALRGLLNSTHTNQTSSTPGGA